MFVVFDFDGVVIDSHRAIRAAVGNVHDYLGFNPPTDEEVAVWSGPSVKQSALRMQEAFHLDDHQREDVARRYFQTIVDVSPDLIGTFPGIADLVNDLRDNAIPIALATMKSQVEMDGMSRPLAALELFDFVAAPRTYEENTSKSELVARAATHLRENRSANGDGFMVGDRASDVVAGHENELRTIAVTWGAGSRDELENAKPEFIVSTPEELRETLLNFTTT